jgi:hypothetical protein
MSTRPGGAEPVPVEYVVGHVQEALGNDGRVGEWGLVITITGPTLTVSGVVGTSARKAAVVEVVEAALEGLGCAYEVVDRTEVGEAPAPTGEEELT